MSNNYQPLKKETAASETSFGLNVLALIMALLFLVLCRLMGFRNNTYLFIAFALILTIFSVGLEYLFYPKTSVLRHVKIYRQLNIKRVMYKEIALGATFLVIGFLYWLFPMFTRNDFAYKYFPFLKSIMPWVIIGSFPYFCFMDKVDPEPEDIYYKIGFSITHFKKTITRFELGNYVRSWLVKAFWLSLMQPAMVEKINWVIHYNWNLMKNNPTEWFWTLNVICFLIDLSYASVGYMMNFKLLNTQTRTAEPTLLGWVVTVMCYWPFWAVLFYPYFFSYETQTWLKILQSGSIAWWICFGLIICLEFLYSIASVAAGIRFSNLTYRGLWNTGIYRYTKHPAYIFKNLSWWLIALPFLRDTASEAIRCSVFLLGINVIYYLRAKTEERHLSHYPEYVAYALEMNQKSIFRWCAKVLPFLKYKPLPENKRLF